MPSLFSLLRGEEALSYPLHDCVGVHCQVSDLLPIGCLIVVSDQANKIKSNQIVFVTSAEYNRCRLYSEMFTYKPLTNNAVLSKYPPPQ